MSSEPSVKSRSLRGVAMTLTSFGGANLMRLASNLVLTRLLMPEAFGLMALVQVFITGLIMFSDTGINTSIVQNKRGDDPAFLNTAWTMQIGRGVLLWILCCAIAYPAGSLYDEPMLATTLPVAGLAPLLQGFSTTNVATANRHLLLGRLTALELGAQAVGIVVMVLLAYQMRSVWALVLGSVFTVALQVALQHLLLPGIRNRLHWDKSAFWTLFNFGKFLFLSTAVTFAIVHGDKAILGAYISLSELGVYNIGYLLGSLPFLLCSAINTKVLFPVYRMKPVTRSSENRRNIAKLRRLILGGAIGICALLAFGGVWLVELMYTPQFALAGPVVVLLSAASVPRILQLSYGQVLLVAGDSKTFFLLNMLTAALQTLLMFLGVIWFGIFGVIVATGLAPILTYPLRAYLVNRYQGWDPKSDLVLFTLGLAATGSACWLHWDGLVKLL